MELKNLLPNSIKKPFNIPVYHFELPASQKLFISHKFVDIPLIFLHYACIFSLVKLKTLLFSMIGKFLMYLSERMCHDFMEKSLLPLFPFLLNEWHVLTVQLFNNSDHL